jgi:uncharacterized protein YwgA
MATIDEAHKVAALVQDAGGRIVGRTRLQKIEFILESAGLGAGFPFRYKHYGPYSEELSSATSTAQALQLIEETEQPASWGGSYSIYTLRTAVNTQSPQARLHICEATVAADAVELELAATALFLAGNGVRDAWGETARRKPEKAGAGRLNRAKALYETLRGIDTPRALPQL